MSKIIFTALSPNVEADDLWLVLKILCQPWTWLQGSQTRKLQDCLKKWLPAQYAYLFDTGRTSLHAILSCLDLKPGEEVLLQAYTCVAVVEPILWVGLKPIFVDIEADSFNMSPTDLESKITPRSKVLIVQHTFGLSANLDKLLSLARNSNLFVIEDCAHALGAEYKGRRVGTFGKASFYSFGRDKVISSVFGGMVTTNDLSLASNLETLREGYPYPRRGWVFKQLLHPVLTSVVKATYDFLELGKIILKISQGFGLLSKAIEPIEKVGGKPAFTSKKLANALAALALNQLYKLERFNQHRDKIAKIYEQGLGVQPLLGVEPLGRIYLRYTLKSSKARGLLEFAKQRGFILGDWYRQGIAPEGVDYEKIGYDPNSCPKAEKVARLSFNLPTHIGIREDDALRIVEFLKPHYARN